MPEPLKARPLTPRPVQQARAQASPGQLIDRTMVASAFDRHGANGATAPDGVIDEDELQAAGVGRVDTDARASIVGAEPENDMAILKPDKVPDDLQPATLASTAGMSASDSKSSR